jgi:hypothetical protein
MRYRLRTLMMLMAVGPPVLAALWFSQYWLPDVILLLFLEIIVLCAVLQILLALSWMLSVIAKFLMRALVSPKNTQVAACSVSRSATCSG